MADFVKRVAPGGTGSGIQAGLNMSILSSRQMTLAYAKMRGLVKLMRRDGVNLPIGPHLIRAIGRAINARIPITRNAIRARMTAR